MSSKNKFRVWDKDLCVYTSKADFKFYRMELKADEAEPIKFSFNTLCPGRYTWEQCTGLTDMNGEEIYEGDILCLPKGDEDEPALYREVVFKDGAFCMKESEGIYSLLNPQTLRYWKVVGNIHSIKE